MQNSKQAGTVADFPTANLTPMLSQYLEIKKNYSDSILFYQMGDFYEMFFEDAVAAAPLLEVQLTSRDRNAADPIPMCGVPIHALATYLPRLLAAGKKVAVCQQVEPSGSPTGGKNLVKREVTRVFTPALVADPELVSADEKNILLVCEPTPHGMAICVVDLLASESRNGMVETTDAWFDLVHEWNPKELLTNQAGMKHRFIDEIKKLFPQLALSERDSFFSGRQPVDRVWNAACAYLKETQGPNGIPLLPPLPMTGGETLKLDAVTVQSLALVRQPWREEKCLSDVLEGTLTSMGRRRLKEWLLHPLANLKGIRERLETVEAFVRDETLAEFVREQLHSLRDLERLATKTHLGLGLPRDLVAIRDVLSRIPEIKKTLTKTKPKRLQLIAKELDPLQAICELLEKSLLDEPGNALREGGIIKDSYHEEIGELRLLARDAKQWIADLENREREKTGITSLKVKFSRVFGYTIEVTKSYLGKVPSHYKRKQTIANGERFITDELKRFEEKALTAEQRLFSLEESLFLDIRRQVAEQSAKLLQNARLISELDVLQGFGRVSKQNGYRKPEVAKDGQLVIEEGRHPVLESVLPAGEFVPNSVLLDGERSRTWLITGPNMAGKSTIMRQVALIAIMAQAGCFVPAKQARIPLFDSVFTRIGSSDDLTRGRSTFMVEMSEVARILEKSTENSLVLIDEIGRGTSTYDGLALAWAILEYLHSEIRSKVLFATHFHELTALEKRLTGLVNKTVLVERTGESIRFLHRLGDGACSRSYGVDVARLAGLPSKVLSRANQVLGKLESHGGKGFKDRGSASRSEVEQLLFLEDSISPERLVQIES